MIAKRCMHKTAAQKCTDPSRAFTSIELLACFAACALLVTIIAPALFARRSQADRVVCLSNLRQIGNAFRQFALEHDGRPPWTAGGNYPRFEEEYLWFQYWWVRDSLGTPKILMDPAETRAGARVATEWGFTPGVGFQSLGNAAVAYGLGRGHYDGNDLRYTDLPQMIVTLDRHFIWQSDRGGLGNIVRVIPGETGWRDEIHGEIGNVAFADGSVNSLTSAQLREAVGKISSTYIRAFNVMPW